MLKIKTKKILSLSLLTGLFCVIPIVAVSCGIAPTAPDTRSTQFHASYNISNDDNLKNLLPSEAAVAFTQDRTVLELIIYKRIIFGNTNDIGAQIVTVDTNSLVASNTNGTLKGQFTIAKYWVNDVLSNEPKILSFTLEGFKVSTATTIFNKSATADIKGTELAQYTVNAITSSDTPLKQWIFNTLITGNKSGLSTSNLITVYDQRDPVAGQFKVTYKLNNYWTDRGLSNQASEAITFTITGFKSNNPSADEILAVINAPGTFNSLNIDKYAPVVSTLDLSNNTRLENINQSFLDKISVVADFVNLKLAIVSGDQRTGTLTLKLSGKYQNIDIPTDKNTIIISGFKTTSADYNIRQGMWITSMRLNTNLAFKDLQTNAKMQVWTPDQWFKYLEDLTAFTGGSNVNLVETTNKYGVLKNVNFANVSQAITTNDWSTFKLEFSFINYKYESGNWAEVNRQTFSYPMDTNVKMQTLTSKLALDYITSNKVNYISSEVTTRHASYWFARMVTDANPEAASTFLAVDQEYADAYFNNMTLVFEAYEDTVVVDDLNGEMMLSYKLTSVDENPAPSSDGYITIKTFAKMQDYITTNTQNIVDNITVLNAGTALFNRIVKSVKAEYTQQQLQDLTVNVETTMTSKPEYFRVGSLEYSIYSADRDISNRLDTALVNNLGDFLLFRTNLNKAILTSNNLFDSRSKDAFFVQWLSLNFKNTTSATLTKAAGDTFKYKVNYEYTLGLLGSEYQGIKGYYFINLSLSDLGY